MAERRTTYLIQDPYDLDAIQFIRTIDLYYGIRPVCVYTSEKDRYYGEREFPILTSDRIERAVDVALDDLGPTVEALAREFDIRGVVPYREDTVEVAAELCELLGIEWNAPETLRRFRDKFALKTFVREVDPSVRVPDCRLVRTAADLLADPLPERFVLKPNDGLGNRSIGIFSAAEVDEAVGHLDREGGPWILEEFIGGVEYHVDGQVRERGEVECLAVYEYARTEVNGYPTVYVGEIQVLTTDHGFEEMTDYARRLLTATGLRRCPFHLEVKVDAEGPCVVDLGARLASEGGGRSLSRMHPTRPDAYAVAAHDYLGLVSVETGPIDWTTYDAARTVLTYGISTESGRIGTISGVDEVERLPEFVGWAVKPEVGHELAVTHDLRGAPYIVELLSPGDRDTALDLMDRVRAMISWNVDAGTVDHATAAARDVGRRLSRKLRWGISRAVSAVRRERPAPDLDNVVEFPNRSIST